MNEVSAGRSLTGPSKATRDKALEVKRGNRSERIAKLAAVVADVAARLEDGTLERRALRHQLIYSEAAISQATYWRYVGQSDLLRRRVEELFGPDNAVLQAEASGAQTDGAVASEPSLTAQLAAADEEIKRLKAFSENLQRQVAVCKTLIDLMELDLKAKTKEVMSKDFDLAFERKRNLELLSSIRDLRTAADDANNISHEAR